MGSDFMFWLAVLFFCCLLLGFLAAFLPDDSGDENR